MKKILAISMIIGLLAACTHTSSSETVPPPAPSPAPVAPAVEAPPPAPTPTPAPAAKTETQVITLDSGNLYFNPKNLSVKVNQPVKVNYTNKGGHSFSVDELGVNVSLTAASGSFSFTPTKTGTFPLYCNVPGHKQAGMVGTLTVE